MLWFDKFVRTNKQLLLPQFSDRYAFTEWNQNRYQFEIYIEKTVIINTEDYMIIKIDKQNVNGTDYAENFGCL